MVFCRRWTRAKYEITVDEPYNPIKQDVNKDGTLRDLDFYQCFNYGALPQTWEDPSHVSSDTGFKGDNDPLDCVEIGTTQVQCGSVITVRILGVLAMIDEGETDWKLIVIRDDDKLAEKIQCYADLVNHMPGAVEGIVEWFTNYKTKLGTKPKNEWALNGDCQDEKYAQKVIEETHSFWRQLVHDEETAKIRRRSTVCLKNAPGVSDENSLESKPIVQSSSAVDLSSISVAQNDTATATLADDGADLDEDGIPVETV